MKKLFLIPLLTLVCSVMAWGATITVGEGGDQTTLAEAVAAASAGDKLQLVSNLTVSSEVNFNKDLTVDFNGSTITAGTNYLLRVPVNVNVTFEDNSANGEGGITAPTGTVLINGSATINGGNFFANAGYVIAENPGASLTINDGLIKYVGTAKKDVLYCNGAELIVNGGTIENTTSYYAIYPINNAQVTINGGLIKNSSTGEAIGLYGNTSSTTPITTTVNINGGSLIAQGGYGITIWGYGATINMTGGSIEARKSAISGNGTAKYGGTTINISGGTITSTNDLAIYHPQAGTLTISGGTIQGKSGVGIKGGTLNMTAGTIHAVGEGGGRVETYGNGMNESNAALQIESNKPSGYAGNMNISISGTATLISDSWYAIYEYGSANTEVNSIAVTGGNFQGGIMLSQSLAAEGGFVSGGKWSEDIAANVVVGKAANPITSGADYEAGYRFEVGNPTEATAEVIPAAPALLVSDQATTQEKADAKAASDKGEVKTSGAGNQAVISQNTDVVKAGDNARVDAKKVTVENNAQLTVTEGATLVVGTGAVHLNKNATAGGLKVEAGATMVVDGLVYGATAENFVIESSEEKAGIVLFSPETEFIGEDHPKATYRFTSKSYWTQATDKWVYQRLGIPTYNGQVHIQSVNYTEGGSWLRRWDYGTDDWSAWTSFSAAGALDVNDAVPFQGFVLASDNDTKGEMVYEFTGSLMGNMDANLNFRYGWNNYANSYTAPLNILEFINTVKATAGSSDILATIYLYNDLGDDTYSWTAVNEATAGSKTVIGFQPGVGPIYAEFPSVVEPMQAFLMKLNAGDDINQAIDYAADVYTPAVTDPSSSAPARRSAANLNRMQVSVYNAEGFDKVFLLEDNNFSDALDNGYDAYKYEGNKGVQLYAMDNDARMEILATDNVDGTFLGIDAPKAGTYTLYLSGVNGGEYAIVDMLNNTVTNISEGAEYSFYAPKGNNDYRFQIISVRQAPTGIEEAAVAKKAGIYTVTGQFVGRDFQALPAGVYVVNGKKVVK